MKVSTLNRIFNILLGALAMLAVAIFSAYIAMRVAIHGREVQVPALANQSFSAAAATAASLGLRLDIENRFYSSVPAGAIISQSPAPGITVRRGYTLRVAQSLGPQQVAIPSFTGQSERLATIAIRRLNLDLGAVAHIPAPGPAGVVLAQTPAASAPGAASDIDSPRVSLLLSSPLPNPSPQPNPTHPADSADPNLDLPSNSEPSAGYVMPSLAGLTLPAAVRLAASAGLHVVSAEESAPPPPTPAPSAASPAPAPPSTPSPTPTPPPATITPTTVIAQTPPAGQHVYPGDPVKITLSHY